MNEPELNFIQQCVLNGDIFWTYHSNMRLAGRSIAREKILKHIHCAEIIESYDEDFPLPSCLCLMFDEQNRPVHVVIALDRPNKHIRMITVYRPDPNQWSDDFRRRNKS